MNLMNLIIQQSVVWEEDKAQEGYEIIEAVKSGESEFLGFRPVSSTPTSLSEAKFAVTQIAPTSPITSLAQSF